MDTKRFENSFKGNPMFSVYEVDNNGDKKKKFDPNTGKPVEPKPLLNLGLKKAMILLSHVEDLKSFVNDNKGE